VAWANRAIRAALRAAAIAGGLLRDAFRSREELLAENALLRQQLLVASRKNKRPAFRAHERGLVVFLSSIMPRGSDALLLVKPDTIIRWHREGLRLLWKRKSKATRTRRSAPSNETIELIQRMAGESRLWRAERIRGELLKLGIRVSKRNVHKYMHSRPIEPHRGQSWKTFLKNHSVWACDFLQPYDIWFRPIFPFLIMNVNTKEVAHVAVTRAPTEQWTAPSPCCRLHFVQTNMEPNCGKQRRWAPGPRY
jgi:putative transposase